MTDSHNCAANMHSHSSHSCNQNLNTKLPSELKITGLPFAGMFNLFASIIFPPWEGNVGPESGYCLLLVIGNTQCRGHIHTAEKKKYFKNIFCVEDMTLFQLKKKFKEIAYNEGDMRWSRKKIELFSLWYETWKYERVWTTRIMMNMICLKQHRTAL